MLVVVDVMVLKLEWLLTVVDVIALKLEWLLVEANLLVVKLVLVLERLLVMKEASFEFRSNDTGLSLNKNYFL